MLPRLKAACTQTSRVSLSWCTGSLNGATREIANLLEISWPLMPLSSIFFPETVSLLLCQINFSLSGATLATAVEKGVQWSRVVIWYNLAKLKVFTLFWVARLFAEFATAPVAPQSWNLVGYIDFFSQKTISFLEHKGPLFIFFVTTTCSIDMTHNKWLNKYMASSLAATLPSLLPWIIHSAEVVWESRLECHWRTSIMNG